MQMMSIISGNVCLDCILCCALQLPYKWILLPFDFFKNISKQILMCVKNINKWLIVEVTNVQCNNVSRCICIVKKYF